MLYITYALMFICRLELIIVYTEYDYFHFDLIMIILLP